MSTRNLSVKRVDLQVLRGVAVLAVLLHHGFPEFFYLGYLGVDAFFVISGFVITPLILSFNQSCMGVKERLSYLAEFYSKRFLRLGPGLFSALTLGLILMLLLAAYSDHIRIGQQSLLSIVSLGNLGAYLYSGDYFSVNPNPLIHTWSLAVETQIYIFLPLILLLIGLLVQLSTKVFAATIFILTFLSLSLDLNPLYTNTFYQIFGIDSGESFSYYSPLNRFWQFGLGGLLALWISNHSSKKHRRLLVVIFFLIALFLALPFGNHSQRVELSITASFLTVVIISFRVFEYLPRVVTSLFCWLGDRSYSIYIVHLPLIYISKYSDIFVTNVIFHQYLLTSGAIVFSLVLGAINYKFIELKFRYSFATSKPRIRIKRFISIGGFLFLALIISGVLALKGPIIQDSNWPQPEKVDPWNWDRNCKFMSSDPEGVTKPCLYLNKGAKMNYLLIGDSHAASLSSTVKKVSQKVNANLYVKTYAGCPFVLRNQVKLFHKEFRVSENCLLQNDSISKLVLQQKITTVIYTQRSTSLYVSNDAFNDKVKFYSMVNASLNDLGRSVERIIFIGITPEYKIKNFLLYSLFGGEGTFLQVPMENNSYWMKSLGPSGIEYLNVMEVFCSNMSCKNSINGRWLFHDGNHLSTLGAEKIGEILFQQLSGYK